MITDDAVERDVVEYYNECWLTRFENGHNPLSLAMHLGYFENEDQSDLAKLNTNRFLFKELGIPLLQSVNVVDLGCGVGGTCFSLSKYNPNAQIVGVNISHEQIEFAKRQAVLLGCEKNPDFVVKNYIDTGLEKNSFDFAYGLESICHAKSKIDVFQEAYSLLKEGGKFAIMDYFEMKECENDTERDLLEDFRNGWAVEEYLKEIEASLTKIGFKEIYEKNITLQVYPGITKSYNKAIQLVSEELDDKSWMYAHFKACIALQKLVDLNIIEYKLVIAVK